MAAKEKKEPAPRLGFGRCPIGCGCRKAVYALSVKGLAFGYCNLCNTQVFARSARSDEVLRANIISDAAPGPGPSSTVVDDDTAGPIAGSDDAGQPAQPPAATPPPPPAPKPKSSWLLQLGQES